MKMLKNTRKFIALLLILGIVVLTSACKGEDKTKKANIVKITDENKGSFRVGYGRVDITPEVSVALAGYGNTTKRLSDGFLDPIYATCIAISDENNETLMILCLDIVGMEYEKSMGVADTLSKNFGVKAENVVVNCTHTHSAPEIGSKYAPNAYFESKMQNGIKEAAAAALNDRKKAKMYFGSTEAPGLAFVRHYFTADGTALGDNHNAIGNTSPIVKHTTDVDNTLFLIKFTREGGNDVLLTNFRGHPTMTGGGSKTDISADWIGAMRIYTEEKLGCNFAYLQGASGNVNSTSRIESEIIDGRNWCTHGKILSEYVENSYNNLTEVETGAVKVKKMTYAAPVNHSDDHLAGYASMVSNLWTTTGDGVAATNLGKQYGIYSPYHANAIRARASYGETMNITFGVFSIGGVGFSCAPYEQFDTNACYVMENSPFKYTVALAYTNGRVSYIPSNYAYEYGCYESDITKFAKGTGEDLASKMVDMLKEIKG